MVQFKVFSDGLTGTDAKVSIVTNTDGGLFYIPFTGDMLSTVHYTPQVRLFINDVPTKCSGVCSFEWRSYMTPSITSVIPTSGELLVDVYCYIPGTLKKWETYWFRFVCLSVSKFHVWIPYGKSRCVIFLELSPLLKGPLVK